MRSVIIKKLVRTGRFAYRSTRNALCAVPATKDLLYPPAALAARFGSADLDYGVGVFSHHMRMLRAGGFDAGASILEVGPGRNLTTALLMWIVSTRTHGASANVVLWDEHRNMQVTAARVAELAGALAGSELLAEARAWLPADVDRTLERVALGELVPAITLQVRPLRELLKRPELFGRTLVYSHAALEHIWHIARFWDVIARLTADGGWHSHRIDLADHGRRETNYVEMLEWSAAEYWLTMRFVPGAVNRWRAGMHEQALRDRGLEIVSAHRDTHPMLPVPRARLAGGFRALPELELRTTALDVVARKRSASVR